MVAMVLNSRFVTNIAAVLIASFLARCAAARTTVVTSSSSWSPIATTNFVIDSLECRARSSCHRLPSDEDDSDEDSVLLTAGNRNCRCDDNCRLYDDCCYDYRIPKRNNVTSLRAIVGCLMLPEVDPTGPIYVINRCPDVRHINEITRQRCEAELPSADGLQLNRLPVVGANTGAIYRNAFCAACNAERDRKYIYWVAKLVLCAGNFPALDKMTRSNLSELVTSSVSARCRLTFHRDVLSARRKTTGSAEHVHETSASVRRCRQHVLSRCDRKWLDRQTTRMCRDGPTSHVFAGRRTFRNRHCAVCNHVNETYLHCTPPTDHHVTAEPTSGFEDSDPYVLIDMNGKETVLHPPSNGDYEDYEYEEEKSVSTTFPFPVCSEPSETYDPFSARCIPEPSTCRPGSTLLLDQGRCTPNDDAAGSTDYDVTKLVARSTDEKYGDDEDVDDVTPMTSSATCPMDGCLSSRGKVHMVDAADYVRNANGTVYVYSLRLAFGERSWCLASSIDDKAPIYVCLKTTDDEPATSAPSRSDASFRASSSSSSSRSPFSLKPFRLSMFQLKNTELLASIFGTLIGIVAYVGALLGACAFRRRRGEPKRRSDTAAKCIVCLLICLFVRHLSYLALITSDTLEDYLRQHLGEGRLCFYASSSFQYFSLASFFWLNALTIEIYRRMKPGNTKWLAHPTVDFVFYSLYAWTMPALAVGWSIAVQLLGLSAWTPFDDAPAEVNSPRETTDDVKSSSVGGDWLSPASTSGACWVLGFVQVILFVLPAALTIVVDVVLFVVTGCRRCLRNGDSDDDDGGTAVGHSPKKMAAVDETLPPPWRRTVPDGEDCGEPDRHRAENLYVFGVQLTLLVSMTWTLCFLSSTLPGAPHSLVWYIYVMFDVALALTTSIAFLTTEHRMWLRLTTRRRKWNRAPPRRSAGGGPGDVIVVEGMAGWPAASATPRMSTTAVTSEPSDVALASVAPCYEDESAIVVEYKDNDSLKVLMKETTI